MTRLGGYPLLPIPASCRSRDTLGFRGTADRLQIALGVRFVALRGHIRRRRDLPLWVRSVPPHGVKHDGRARTPPVGRSCLRRKAYTEGSYARAVPCGKSSDYSSL